MTIETTGGMVVIGGVAPEGGRNVENRRRAENWADQPADTPRNIDAPTIAEWGQGSQPVRISQNSRPTSRHPAELETAKRLDSG